MLRPTKSSMILTGHRTKISIRSRSDFTPLGRRRMFEGAWRPISRLRRHPCRRFRHPVPVAIFMRRGRTGGRWFHGIWKVSGAKTASTHKEGWFRDGRRKGRKTVIVCEKKGCRKGEREGKREREPTSKRYVVASGLGQTKNHGVSFVSGGARDARMKFHRKLVVCWTEAVTRIRSLRHHLGAAFSEILEINFHPNTFESINTERNVLKSLCKIFYLLVLVCLF